MRFAVLLCAAGVFCAAADHTPWYGRWDLTLKNGAGETGGWLEVSRSGIRMVPRVGGVRPVPESNWLDGRLEFRNTEWFGKWERVTYTLDLNGDRLSGTAARESGPVMEVSGVRAPSLDRRVSKWGAPVKLDFPAWKVMSATKPGNWAATDGTITNAKSGPNLRTSDEFQDFRLDLEFNCPAGSNSGVFLRGRYEIQIEEEPQTTAAVERTGSVYQFVAPSVEAPGRPGEWRKFSITLVGRTVTVVLDGTTIIDGAQIPGPTSGGFNSREAEPGPLILQGDHGAVSFRNIILTPAEAR